MIKFQHISKNYGKTAILKDIGLTLILFLNLFILIKLLYPRVD